MQTSEFIASYLLQIKAIQISPKKPFVWASGIKSPIYCDNRLTLSYPYLRSMIIEGFIDLSNRMTAFEMVAGVATAGIPHGILLADRLGLPFIYVRSKPKEHGRQNQIEGESPSGKNVLVIEDLISTGKSSMQAIEALEQAGSKVVGLAAIFTYCFDLSSSLFAGHGIQVETLTSYTELLDIALKNDFLTDEEYNLLKTWHKQPEKWFDEL
jgi:orotate phosphoribosyltransferase